MHNLHLMYLSIYATNIISSTAELSLKYKNQMVRNSKPAISCYEDTISTLNNLKNLFFPA